MALKSTLRKILHFGASQIADIALKIMARTEDVSIQNPYVFEDEPEEEVEHHFDGLQCPPVTFSEEALRMRAQGRMVSEKIKVIEETPTGSVQYRIRRARGF